MPSLHDRVIAELGARLVSGRLDSGGLRNAEDLATEFGVSRSVVREALRVLETLGLVESVRRVGLRVLPRERWEVYDPRVIAWRLDSDDAGAQLRSLTELRSAVEPAAAALAARHASDDQGLELLRLAAEMRVLGRRGDLTGFLALDVRFHGLVLASGGNEMFAKLGGSIEAVLRGRTARGLMPEHPDDHALQHHVDVADAIQGRRTEEARTAMEAIVSLAAEELGSVWRESPRG